MMLQITVVKMVIALYSSTEIYNIPNSIVIKIAFQTLPYSSIQNTITHESSVQPNLLI